VGHEIGGTQEGHGLETIDWRGSSSASRVGIGRRERRDVGGGQAGRPGVGRVERGG
jgi:hypothetical protein